MPAQGIHHLDLTVADVERSPAFDPDGIRVEGCSWDETDGAG
jgi:hypothetical protein